MDLLSITPSLDNVKDRSLHFCEFVKGRFYFATVSDINLKNIQKKCDSSIEYLYIDNEFNYEPFNKDFGPLNLGMLYQYCKKINSLFLRKSTIIHLTTCDKEKRVNAAYLAGCYCIICLNISPSEILNRLTDLSVSYLALKNFTPFVHAGFEACRYFLQVEDCFEAIHKAVKYKFFDFDTFNLRDYQFYEKVENGDLNWIVPNKFIAFCDPYAYSGASKPIKFYLNYFKQQNVSDVIRLNKSLYDAKWFTEKGFHHHNLIFMDGSSPSDFIMREFLNICETASGAIAIHCKAGLGRTGTLIACYLMKHYRFTALEAIAWLRICRPGSVIGYQQKFLENKQSFLWCQGDLYNDTQTSSRLNKQNINIRNSNSNCRTHPKSNLDNENNNTLELKIVKCHAINSKDVNANNSVNSCSKPNVNLNKLISDINNINLKESVPNESNGPNFTQGDFLNEIKLNRKKSESAFHLQPVKVSSSKYHLTNSQFKNSLKNIDYNNNFRITPMEDHKSSAICNPSPEDSQLKVYGKKMKKYSFSSKVLPR